MRMHYGLGLGLVVLLTLAGCCSPMNCSPMMSCMQSCSYPQPYCGPAYGGQACCPQPYCPQPYCPQDCCPQLTWSEHLEDAYYCVSDNVHYYSCHLQRKVSRSMQALMAKMTPTSYEGENDYSEMPPSAKVPPMSPDNQKVSRRQRGKVCARCKQSPCRCGQGEVGDGFEEVDPNVPASTGECQGDCQSAPAEYSDPNMYMQEPQAVPPDPTNGPTPVFQTPPAGAPAEPPVPPVAPPAVPATPPAPTETPPTARLSRPAAPRNPTAARPVMRVSGQSVEPRRIGSPIPVTVPAEEEFKLKPINFSTHAPLGEKDGWEPASQGQ